MQGFAFGCALALLGLGGLLNTAVLLYFVCRSCRVLTPRAFPHQVLLKQVLASVHR